MTEICFEIEVVFKFDSLKIPKNSKFSSSGKEKVRLFKKMTTNAAVLSEKKPPLGGTGNVNSADLAL